MYYHADGGERDLSQNTNALLAAAGRQVTTAGLPVDHVSQRGFKCPLKGPE